MRMRRVMGILGVLFMLVGLVDKGYGNNGKDSDGKILCTGVHGMIRMCGYYGVFSNGPCSEVFSMIRKVFREHGFTNEQANTIGQGCVFICTQLREKVLSIMEFERNMNEGYLECLKKYNKENEAGKKK